MTVEDLKERFHIGFEQKGQGRILSESEKRSTNIGYLFFAIKIALTVTRNYLATEYGVCMLSRSVISDSL